MMERKSREKKSLTPMEETIAKHNEMQNMDRNSVEELNRSLETEFAEEATPTEAARHQTATYEEEMGEEVSPGFTSVDAQRLHEAYKQSPENPANQPAPETNNQ